MFNLITWIDHSLLYQRNKWRQIHKNDLSFQSDVGPDNYSCNVDRLTLGGAKQMHELFASDVTRGANGNAFEENAEDEYCVDDENFYIGFYDFH